MRKFVFIRKFVFALPILLLLAAGLLSQEAEGPFPPNGEQRAEIESKSALLAERITALASRGVEPAVLADVAIYQKAAEWIMRYPEEFYRANYVEYTIESLNRGLARAFALEKGQRPWTKEFGRITRGYISKVDGSVQPYGLVIPKSYDGGKAVRLDVILHGRNARLTEASFIGTHDTNDPVPAEQDFIQLEVFGRTNNAYRWAGERDVYEALEAVRANYRIDPDRIVLRGFSMGGAGAWHIGLHDPSRWAAIEAGAGFTDTVVYAKLPNLPPYQRAAAHIYDAVDYALNATDVPTVGYGGEIDAQLQASVNIREALAREGFRFRPDGLNWQTPDLTAVFLVGPNTPHRFHPDSKAESNAFIDKAVASAPRSPSQVRFVTYTARYGKCFWVEIDGLQKHYERAEVDARRRNEGGGVAVIVKTSNVSRLVLSDTSAVTSLIVDGQNVRPYRGGRDQIYLGRDDAGAWAAASSLLVLRGRGLVKRAGLQGPIDDAFMDKFLCVRPSGAPYSPLAGKRAQATLDLFQNEFPKWLRGAVPVKNDREVTHGDLTENNLILFGDPSSNTVLRRIAPKLPIVWTGTEIIVGKQRFDAANHILAMIYPNPLNTDHYVVINSGHTFHETEFRGTNALLFPRLGDYAVLRVDGGDEQLANPDVELAGFFGESWQLPAGGN